MTNNFPLPSHPRSFHQKKNSLHPTFFDKSSTRSHFICLQFQFDVIKKRKTWKNMRNSFCSPSHNLFPHRSASFAHIFLPPHPQKFDWFHFSPKSWKFFWLIFFSPIFFLLHLIGDFFTYIKTMVLTSFGKTFFTFWFFLENEKLCFLGLKILNFFLSFPKYLFVFPEFVETKWRSFIAKKICLNI